MALRRCGGTKVALRRCVVSKDVWWWLKGGVVSLRRCGGSKEVCFLS